MPPSPLTEARAHLAAVLAPVGVQVYATPPESPTYPSLSITANEEWLIGQRLDAKVANVRLTIRVAVAITGGNIKALERLESLVWDVVTTVACVGPILAPRTDTQGQSEIYTVDLPTVVRITN